MQHFGLLPDEIDIKTLVPASRGHTTQTIEIHTGGPDRKVIGEDAEEGHVF